MSKHDKPLVGIIPEGKPRLDSIREAVAGLRELRKRIAARTRGKSKVTFDDFKSAVEEGRR